jgi:ZIP family zinc transporter
MLETIIGLMIPFVGTVLGAVVVFFVKDTINQKFEKVMLGFAGGVMFAASIWSLIIPSINRVETMGRFRFVPALVGVILGVGVMILFDYLLEKKKTNRQSKTKMIFAITLHNIPEGLAVGVAFAGLFWGEVDSVWVAFALAIGIAIQNIPEGAIVSLPLSQKGLKKSKAFGCGVLSGAVEPIFAFVAVLLVGVVGAILPYILAMAAGCMIYVVVDEIIPEMKNDGAKLGTFGFVIGFLIMMVLDVAFG